MIESAPKSTPEVDLNPHSDLPAGGVISTEISPVPAGERQGVSPPSAIAPALPFGVYLGTPAVVADAPPAIP